MTKSMSDRAWRLERGDFQGLLSALAAEGFKILGPAIRDGAIVYDDIRRVEDLPVGWTDEQSGGTYRLKKRADGALFGYAAGPHSCKKVFHPPTLTLWKTARREGKWTFDPPPAESEPLALLGVRACELHAVAIQDRVFLREPFVDPHYKARRARSFIVAVNCCQPGGTCFCASMGTGPGVSSGFDLALTEVLDGGDHFFVLRAGTDSGARLMERLPGREAAESDLRLAAQRVADAAGRMGRAMETAQLKEDLYANLEHPRWDETAARCLACTNCTMVCPTCFCTTVVDATALNGAQAERRRTWDSCFALEFSYMFGGHLRRSGRSRYRQWLTHKLAYWQDQFGVCGCVGCGRCITWCPVGIDITEEVRALRGADAKEGSHG